MKHAFLLRNMVANGGKSGHRRSISQAARDAGYSEAYIRSGKLQKTKAWKKAIQDYLPDERLLQIHRELLEAYAIRQIPFFHKTTDFEIKKVIESVGFIFIATKRFKDTAYVYVAMPNNMTRLRALDMAYKLKGRYKHQSTHQSEYARMSDEDIEQEIISIIVEAIDNI